MKTPPASTLKNKSFSAFIATQLLGAFNDNVFKQMMLLLAVGGAVAAAGDEPGKDIQGIVMMVFTLPFLLFSGYAGQLSEIYAKTTIMRLSKIAELLIMVLGTLGFYWNNWTFLLVVLFLMGTQSAFFGPAKYGVIPELVEDKILVSANGVVQMTTIMAIILGIALGGWLKDLFEGRLYMASFTCIFISLFGIASVYQISRREANRPEMRLDPNPMGRLWLSFKEIHADKPLLLALIAYTYFYFSGALVANTVNNYGLIILKLNNTQTSLLLVILSGGIMVGSLAAAPIQRRLGGKWTIFTGAIGVAIAEFFLTFYTFPLGLLRAFLFMAGAFSGLYFVPIAAFMQSRPPLGKKGEILAAVNFSNFAGIMVSAFLWQGLMALGFPSYYMWTLLSIGLAILLVIMFPQLKRID